MRSARAPGRRVARVLLGLFIVLGRLALGPGPIRALGLGWLARGTEPGPMVPITVFMKMGVFVELPKWPRRSKRKKN